MPGRVAGPNMKRKVSSDGLPIFFHLKWVAKIALSVGALAGIALLLALFLITDDKGVEYGHIIFNDNLTRQNLGPAMLVFGLAMAVMASFITWLISLYTSFRIIGPLFRFSRNLKMAVEHPSAVPVAIRQTDMLQRESKEFEASLVRLGEHYRCLREALDHARQTLPADAGPDLLALRQAVARLGETERLVQL